MDEEVEGAGGQETHDELGFFAVFCPSGQLLLLLVQLTGDIAAGLKKLFEGCGTTVHPTSQSRRLASIIRGEDAVKQKGRNALRFVQLQDPERF